jgi:hypothetical protein
MAEPSNGDLMRALGNLEANFSNAAKNADAEARRASESRRVLHEKIEDTSATIQKVSNDVLSAVFQLQATTDIAIQARDGLNSFAAKYEKEAAPILEGIATFRSEVEPLLRATRAVKNWAALFAILAGAGVISTAGIVAFFNAALKAWITAWLNSP